MYKRQIYQIAESNRIETFLPELECSTVLCGCLRLRCGRRSEPVSSLVFLDGGNSTTSASPAVIRMVESRPSALRCVALGGYPPPSMSLYVGRRDLTAHCRLGRSVSLAGSGVPGLRRIAVRSERWEGELSK